MWFASESAPAFAAALAVSHGGRAASVTSFSAERRGQVCHEQGHLIRRTFEALRAARDDAEVPVAGVITQLARCEPRALRLGQRLLQVRDGGCCVAPDLPREVIALAESAGDAEQIVAQVLSCGCGGRESPQSPLAEVAATIVAASIGGFADALAPPASEIDDARRPILRGHTAEFSRTLTAAYVTAALPLRMLPESADDIAALVQTFALASACSVVGAALETRAGGRAAALEALHAIVAA